jgi:hypothetical protein
MPISFKIRQLGILIIIIAVNKVLKTMKKMFTITAFPAGGSGS